MLRVIVAMTIAAASAAYGQILSAAGCCRSEAWKIMHPGP